MRVLSIEQCNQNQYNQYGYTLKKFLYKPMVPLPDLSEYINRWIEVRVHKSYVSRQNKAFRYRNFYGSDQYTSDSDVVCILQHSSHLRVPDFENEDQSFDGYSVIFKVLRGRP